MIIIYIENEIKANNCWRSECGKPDACSLGKSRHYSIGNSQTQEYEFIKLVI